MKNRDDRRTEYLLDWHLERLEGADRDWIEAELDRDVAFRRQSDQLQRVLRPLDNWHALPSSPNLADKTLDYVYAATQEPVLSITPSESAPRRGPSFRWRDVIAAAACIVILVGALVPGMSLVRSRARQAQCAGNLASIFRGVGVYQELFGGALPYAGQPAVGAWLPTSASQRPFRSNSRHLFRLVKYDCGPKPAEFICPSDADARPMLVKDVTAREDFDCRRNVSYDSLNLAGPKPNVRPTVPLVYVSDPNPLFVGGRFNRKVDPDTTNSPAHGGRGQNALTTTGEAVFMPTPFYGTHNDNVWLAGNIREYDGTESPVSDRDIQLVPGCPKSDRADASHTH